MLKNKLWIGIILSIILMAFSINGFTAYYKYTQESGTNFYVGTADKADALEDTNEMRQILDDLGNLLGHSKRDDLYPKNGTTGGYLGRLNYGLDTSKPAVPIVNDMYLATDTTKIYRCFVAGNWVQVYPVTIENNVIKTGAFTAGRIVKINNTTGIIEQGTNTDTEVADAVTKKHTQNADTDLDTTFEATFVKKTDTVNVLSDITSPGANIEDAVTKRHTQNTDQYLDFGGANQVAVTDVKDAVDKKHTSGSETCTGDVSGTVGANTVDKIKGHTVDETAIADNKILVYKTTGDKYVYETQSGGAGTYLELTDTPATYDNGKYAKSTVDGVIWDIPSGGYTNLTSFVDQTAWRLFYSNNLGDVTELAFGTDGQYLKSTGATSAPIFDDPAGVGDMLKATYDTDADNIVDKAETVDDGVGNSSTAADVKDAVTKKHSQNTDTDLDATFEATFAKKANKLNVFAATTSLELKGVISDETGSGKAVFGTSPAITTPTGIVKADVGLGNVTNDAQIAKSLGTAQGDIIYFSASATPVRLAKGTAGKVLTMNAGATAPEWATAAAALRGNITWNPDVLSDGAGETSLAIAVTGAALGDFVIASAPYNLQGCTVTAYVSSANVVRIRLQNESGSGFDGPSGNWKVYVLK